MLYLYLVGTGRCKAIIRVLGFARDHFADVLEAVEKLIDVVLGARVAGCYDAQLGW
jgi:hypothetical protein